MSALWRLARIVGNGHIVDMLVMMNPRIAGDMIVLQQRLQCWAGTSTDAVRQVVTEKSCSCSGRGAMLIPSFVCSLVCDDLHALALSSAPFIMKLLQLTWCIACELQSSEQKVNT
jgi:hypothetical protein